MKVTRESLAKIIIKKAISIYVILIILLLTVVLYFFQKEIMHNSIIYGDFALRNSALSIEADNIQYSNVAQQISSTIAYQLHIDKREDFSKSNIINYLSDILSRENNLRGSFLILGSEFAKANKEKIHTDNEGNFSVYVGQSGVFPFANYKVQDYYSIPKKTLLSFVSNPYFRNINKEKHKIYTIAYPIIVEGEFAGVIGCDVAIEAVYAQLENIVIYDGNASVALLDAKGDYLAHSVSKDLIGKNLKEDCIDPETRLKNLREGTVDNWFEGTIGSITNPIYFNGHQTPWQLQAKVNAKIVFANVITAFWWILPTIILVVLYFILRMQSFIGNRIKPLAQLDEISSKIADGDLTLDISIQSKNEIGRLADSFKIMVEKLQLFVSEVQQGSENITQASQQLSTSSQTLSSSTNEQASTGEEISSNMEEMTASVQQNANKSLEIKTASASIGIKFEQISNSAEEANNMQNQIAVLSQLINDIGLNIKILAINAAVEAARAGEHGKGFSVIAREVQKLSENTTNSADKITEKILISVKMSEDAMELTKEVQLQLTVLNESIEEINVSSQEQSSNIQQVSKATQQFNESTQSNAASAEELASTAEELNSQSEVLMGFAKQFKIKN